MCGLDHEFDLRDEGNKNKHSKQRASNQTNKLAEIININA
jgi:hypothetical protein